MEINIKKEVLPALLCGALSFGAVSADESADSSSDAANLAHFIGWYAGAGVNHQYTKGEALLDDNLGVVNPGRSSDAHGFQLVSSHPGKIGGTLLVGYGKVFRGSLYLGAELDLDITGNSDRTRTTDYGTSKLKTRGFVPTIAVRLGGVLHAWNCMFYGRFGFAFWENKFESRAYGKVSSRKFTPVLGLGVEKMFANKLSVRLEGDYRFGADKTKSNLAVYDDRGARVNGASASIKNKVRGFATRLVCTYHF